MYQDNAVDTHFTAFLCVLSDLHEEFPSTPVPKAAELTALVRVLQTERTNGMSPFIPVDGDLLQGIGSLDSGAGKSRDVRGGLTGWRPIGAEGVSSSPSQRPEHPQSRWCHFRLRNGRQVLGTLLQYCDPEGRTGTPGRTLTLGPKPGTWKGGRLQTRG